MTERKKPGPKPKCKECGRKEGEGHYDDCPVGMGAVTQGDDHLRLITAVLKQEGGPSEIARRQAVGFARKVWAGQSDSLPRKERLERVRKALEKRGMSMEGVEL
jgi:hypothetical protein